eukprot:TRINITY_DN9072_c0_g1_i5.p1 TRINITY_DN9072_c0_g1~~TRINITY_DN9072_c0_g1_i5.p1  ORF type:complete len:327 (-),score=61.17 TRINITY_DN9072_c0_g1_i5:377-1357(-)
MKLQFKLLLAFCSLISQKLCYLPDLCGGADPIEVCCGGGEYPGNGCCAAVSCLDILPFPAVDYGNNCAAVLCSSEVLDPQCCNGVDYPNTCLAQCANAGNLDNCQPGECEDEPVICPAIFAPLCCNTKTFSHDCFATAKFGDDVDSICVPGACEDQVACPATFDLVCCFETELFGNRCEAERKYGNLPNFSEVCIGDCAPRSPECDQPANCFVDPCQLATCKFSGAVCVPNYCEGATYLGTDVGGPCNAIWVDPQNKVVLTQQQCRKPFGFGDILGGVGNYIPVCCDGRTYFNIDRAESDLGVTAAAELCVDGACSISIFPGFTSP